MRKESEKHLKSSTTRGTMKLAFVIVSLLAAAASGAIEKRVTGSKSCKTNRQYHVQIQSVQVGKSCGGSLLNTRWVITASHCAEQVVDLRIGVNADVALHTKIGSFFKSLFGGKSNPWEQRIETGKQFTYKDEEGKAHDIMLIRLNEDVSSKLPTIELPPVDCSKPEIGQDVEIGGWGAKKVDSQNKLPKSLKCATTKISTCGENDTPGAQYASSEDSTMCAFKPGVDVCFGDGGSAVEYNNLLYGIVVSNPADKCISSVVTVNICHYRQWIEDTMKTNE